ncbi:MAG: DUF3784 domain-containing protein [Proteobacteria bacterium]|nr:DUF3784 domain-containing protein [Pseudomonadota bacterium]MBU1639715.1 DUF3784 domain-containing protein [Pseudomonadota bacterium]
MSTAKIIELIVMEGTALILLAFAYLIGVKGRLELIAGYNDKTAHHVTDKAGLQRLITRLCLLLAAGSALMPVLTALVAHTPHGLAYAVGGYGGFIAGIIGMVMLQARDYTS